MPCECACFCGDAPLLEDLSAWPVMAVELLDIAVDGVSLGLYPEERQARQSVVVHVRLGLDVRGVARADAVEQTADYAAVVAGTTDVCQSRHFELLETLVMAVAQHLLVAHRTLVYAEVTIEKTHAPVAARVAARWRLHRRDLDAISLVAPASGERRP